MPVDRPARHADARHHPVRRGAPQNAGERRNPETSTGHMAHVTFKQMMNEVVAFASCCECSTCVLVCPHNVIEYIDAKPKQVAKPTAAFDYCGISEGIGCDVCSGLPPPRRPRVRHARRGPPGRAGVYEGLFGRYRRGVAARCRDPEILARRQGGGVVTAILCHGLREGSSMVRACPRPPTRAPCPSEGQNLPLRARSCPIPCGISFAFPQVFSGSSPLLR